MVQLSRRRWTRRRHDEHGAVAVVFAVSAVLIFILAALVVDLGHARDVRRQAQNAVDASALAAGNALYTVGKTPYFAASVAAAKEYAEENYGVDAAAWSSCTDSGALSHQPGGTSCISYDNATLPTEIRIVIPSRVVKTPLAGVIGSSELSVSAIAQMKLTPNAMAACGLCIIGSGPHDLQNGDAIVIEGNVHFNGSVGVGPNGLVSTNGIITVENSASGSNYDPPAITGADPIDDPLGFVTAPDYSALTPKSNPCASGTAGGPGIYGGFTAGCDSLQPGLYVITGLWKFTGGSNLIGPGVTLYFTCGTAAVPRGCNPGEAGGALDAAGNGTIKITAPTSDPNKGMAIWYDHNNVSQLRLAGNGSSQYTGTIYAPSATMDYRGNGCSVVNNSLIVVGSLTFSGNPACLETTYDGAMNVDMPPGDLHLSL